MAYWLPFVVIGGTLLIFGIIALFSGSRRRRLLALGFRVLGVAIAILSFVGVWIYAAFYTSDTLLPSYVPLVLMVAWPALFVVGSLIREGLLANEQARNQQGLAYKILFALWLGLGLALFIGQAIIAAKTEASYQWLAFSVAIVCAIACTIAVCVSIYRAYQGAKLPRLNARKGLAGVIFADVANFMAIVAGVAAPASFPFTGGGGAYRS